MTLGTPRWEEVLDAIEARLGEWSAVVGGGPLPSDVVWPTTSVPPRLAPRAKAALAELQKVETEMAAHSAALHAVIESGREPSRPTRTPLFVDRRA